MKVLERKNWENDFSLECTCPQCESKLLIEWADLQHTPSYQGHHVLEDQDETFHVVCEVCLKYIPVPTSSIPTYIQVLARKRCKNVRDDELRLRA